MQFLIDPMDGGFESIIDLGCDQNCLVGCACNMIAGCGCKDPIRPVQEPVS
jgi:hypothetical protein